MKKISIFVDVQNIYYTTRQIYGRQFNYQKLWRRISSKGKIVSATAYAIDRGDEQQLKFQNALKQIGFTVKLKPYIQRSDGTAKGDWDVGITIDIMEAATSVDTIILLSGDGDFDLLLKKSERIILSAPKSMVCQHSQQTLLLIPPASTIVLKTIYYYRNLKLKSKVSATCVACTQGHQQWPSH